MTLHHCVQVGATSNLAAIITVKVTTLPVSCLLAGGSGLSAAAWPHSQHLAENPLLHS